MELVKENGHKLLYLPPYSPELNPIEKYWADLKRQMKKYYVILQILMRHLPVFFKPILLYAYSNFFVNSAIDVLINVMLTKLDLS